MWSWLHTLILAIRVRVGDRVNSPTVKIAECDKRHIVLSLYYFNYRALKLNSANTSKCISYWRICWNMWWSNVRRNTKLYRWENDADFKEFITDLRITNVGKPDFRTYGTTECRKSLSWTNKTRKAINYKWMQDEGKDNVYIIINRAE